MLKRIFITAGALALMLPLCSCNGLPAGTPPPGNIVEPPGNLEALPEAAAINYMITSMTTVCLREIPSGAAVSTDFHAPAPSLNRLPAKVIAVTAATVKMRRPGPALVAQYLLRSDLEEQNGRLDWRMRLSRCQDGKILWQEKLAVMLPPDKSRGR